MVVKLEADFYHEDARGTICQLLHTQNAQVNYLFTRKSAKRGCHYHKRNKEIFYVIEGRACLTSYPAGNKDETQTSYFQAKDMFLVEPFTVHNFDFLEDTHMIVIYDKGIEEDEIKDIYVEEHRVDKPCSKSGWHPARE